MKQALLVLLAAGLLALAACGDGDSAPSATDTPALRATATSAPATATAPADATETRPAATEPPATATSRPDAGEPCPDGAPALCNLAEALDRALRLGQLDAVVANVELKSQTCSGLAQVGPCFGMDEGAEISGYLVGIDASDSISYLSGEEYLSVLQDIAASDAQAADEYGDGAWRLAAIVDEGPDMKVLVTTSIGSDPIYGDPAPARRVFLFRLQRMGGDWRISILLTTGFIEQYLTGVNPGGQAVPGWRAWDGG